MIDYLFGALEDIYFTVVTEPKSDIENSSAVMNFSNTTLLPLIDEFKEKAQSQMYIGKSGNQFKLLKTATLFLNYMMYEDDGVFSEDEKELIQSYIKSKLSRLITSEKDELNKVFDIQATIEQLKNYIVTHELPLRSLDMILDKIIDHTNNQPRYFGPLENIYKMLLETI